MITIKDECCSCTKPGCGCTGNRCTKKHVQHFYCDNCAAEVLYLFSYNGKQLCEDCLPDSVDADEIASVSEEVAL